MCTPERSNTDGTEVTQPHPTVETNGNRTKRDRLASDTPETSTKPLNDDSVLLRAVRSIQQILDTMESNPDEQAVDEAIQALRTLRGYVTDQGERYLQRKEERRNLQLLITQTEENQSRVDRAIIDARIKAGDLVMTRDALARDVARAKRALATLEVDASPNHARRASEDSHRVPHRKMSTFANRSDGGFSRRRSTSRISCDSDDEVVLVPLERDLQIEVDKLRLTEQQLVDTMDEMNRLAKIRADLRRKVKDAEREW